MKRWSHEAIRKDSLAVMERAVRVVFEGQGAAYLGVAGDRVDGGENR